MMLTDIAIGVGYKGPVKNLPSGRGTLANIDSRNLPTYLNFARTIFPYLHGSSFKSAETTRAQISAKSGGKWTFYLWAATCSS